MRPNATAPTRKTSSFSFYDIESLDNVFTLCVYTPRTAANEAHLATSRLNAYIMLQPDALPAGFTEIDQVMDALNSPAALEVMRQKNPAMDPDTEIKTFCLNYMYGVTHLAHSLGAWLPTNPQRSLVNHLDATTPMHVAVSGQPYPLPRPTCDTDPNYDPSRPDHGFIIGYNSINYDTTMAAQLIYLCFRHQWDTSISDQPTWLMNHDCTPKKMRSFNNLLFDQHRKSMAKALGGARDHDNHAYFIRQSMLRTGRHLDLTRFNEVQRMAALKRQLGTAGYQILESDKLDDRNAVIEDIDQLVDLVAYNISDCVGLHEMLNLPEYGPNIDLKISLLYQYPELVYNTRDNVPMIDPSQVNPYRKTADATSAQLVQKILSPSGSLPDLPAVDLSYPHPDVAEQMGIEVYNTLDDLRDFVYTHVTNPHALRSFDMVYDYYSSIQGKNFNSDLFDPEMEDFLASMQPGGESPGYYSLDEIPLKPTTVHYVDNQQRLSSCVATFSTGGIHGSETNLALYLKDRSEVESYNARLAEAQQLFESPEQLQAARSFTASDGTEVSYGQLTSKPTGQPRQWRNPKPLPELLKQRANGSNEINPKYTFTSVGMAQHEDFSSYYPSLLTNMRAFDNPSLGEDRYVTNYNLKEEYGKKQKQDDISDEMRETYKVLRNGVKLVLNTASGAGDTKYDNPIRMNNRIISMRLIGQILLWKIALAQSLAGGRAVSTNTDGAYIMDLDPQTNQKVLDELSTKIGVLIEPEQLLIVSKDANNRLEIGRPGKYEIEKIQKKDPEKAQRIRQKIQDDIWDLESTVIAGASGGTLACWNGPRLDKALAHAAVMDAMLVDYMHLIALGHTPHGWDRPLQMSDPMHLDTVRELLDRRMQQWDSTHTLRMFQIMVTSSTTSIAVPFAMKIMDPEDIQARRQARIAELTAANRKIPAQMSIDELVPAHERYTAESMQSLQRFNRAFIVGNDTPGAVNIGKIAALKSPTNQQATPAMLEILQSAGYTPAAKPIPGYEMIPSSNKIRVTKLKGIELDWPMLIINDDLYLLDEDRKRDLIQNHINVETYLAMIQTTFDKVWRNKI